MALEPITRQEQIIAGKDLEPITRMEKFLKQYGGGSGGGALIVSTHFDGEDRISSASYEEVRAAIEAGRNVFLHTMSGGVEVMLPLSMLHYDRNAVNWKRFEFIGLDMTCWVYTLGDNSLIIQEDIIEGTLNEREALPPPA